MKAQLQKAVEFKLFIEENAHTHARTQASKLTHMQKKMSCLHTDIWTYFLVHNASSERMPEVTACFLVNRESNTHTQTRTRTRTLQYNSST